MKPLPRSFYLCPTLQVARDLLGKHIIRKIDDKLLIGKIVEVEAYCKGDPASHAFRGRTKRNDVMFWEGGHLYVYFTYGMHFCANVVTGNEGIGEAVLIRAVEPLAGIEMMKINRYGSNKS
ncbi:MAG: DNA-3-methyladenine glycosylase, partial [Bacteroidota bacterium]